MRYVTNEQLYRLIGIDGAERVLRETYRQRRAFEWARGRRVLRRGSAAPYVARALAEGDEHAHG